MSATRISLKDHIEATLTANGFHGLEVIGGQGSTISATVHPDQSDSDWPHIAGKITSALQRNGLTVELCAGYLHVTSSAAQHPTAADLSQVPGDTRYIKVEGHVYEYWSGPCPDGCGKIIAWAPGVMPFNAASADEVHDVLRSLYAKAARFA